MSNFQVGDEVVPNTVEGQHYALTCKPIMLKGVITEVRSSRSIWVTITETKNDKHLGSTHLVDPKHFNLARPLTKDEAFDKFLRGSITEAQYSEAIRRERG